MYGVLADSRYYRGRNDYQYDYEVHLRYHILQLYKESLGPMEP